MAQKLLVTNTVVLQRFNMLQLATGSTPTVTPVVINIQVPVEAIFVLFHNNNTALPVNRARFILYNVENIDYYAWERDDLSSLNYGLVEDSFFTEFRYFKYNTASANHYYSWYIKPNDYIEKINLVFNRGASQFTYEVFIKRI